MNSTQTTGTRHTASVLAVGVFELVSLQAQAQVASTSRSAAVSHSTTGVTTDARMNGGAPASHVGANGVNIAGSTNNASSGSAGNVYNGANAMTYFGYPDSSGYGSYFARPSFGGFNSGTFGSGNITFIGSDTYGGFATLGPGGTHLFGQASGYIPVGNPGSAAYNPSANNVNAAAPHSNSLSGKSAQDTQAKPEEPSLVQSLFVRRGRNFDVSIGWRGNPKLIGGLTVTLLNRYHLPVSQQTAEAGTEAYFPANKDTFSAQYYRVDVQYADGAVASLMASLQK